MITAARLAGFFAAHAIWSVSDGGSLIPMLAYTGGESDERKMERLVAEQDVASVEMGKERLATNRMDASDAVLLYNAHIGLQEGKFDAVIVEMRAYFSPDSEAVLAIPYTRTDSGAFHVHKPKLLDWENCDDFDIDAAMEQFFAGVDEHAEGAKVWSAALDESV